MDEKTKKQLIQEINELREQIVTFKNKSEEPIDKPLKNKIRTDYKKIIESLNEIVFMLDNKGIINYISPLVKDYFGYDSKELTGEKVTDFFFTDELLQELLGKLNETENITFETKMFDKGNRELWIQISCRALKKSKRISSVYGIITDITEIKRNELEVKKTRKELESTNKNLKNAINKANKMAYHANIASQAKNQFIANISHELRTPLNGILGMIEILIDSNLTDDQKECAGIVKSSAENLLLIIKNLLDFSKIESGKINLDKIDFDLRILLNDVIDILRIQAEKKDLELSCSIDPEVPSLLHGDPGRLRQIFMHIIGNGIKFTEKGSVDVNIKLDYENPSYTSILIEVKDTGIGISDDEKKYLFKSFSQVDESFTRKYGGVGLGLVISKQLAELMGGTISVESEKGKGSVFRVSAVFEKQKNMLPQDEVLLYEYNYKNILVIAEHPTDKYILQKHLLSFGLSVDTAEINDDIIKKLIKAKYNNRMYDILLIDSDQIDGDIVKLGTEIHKNNELKNTILILLTSTGRRGDVKKSKHSGFSAYLTKPVTREMLHDCLISLNNGMEKNKSGKIITKHSLAEEEKHRIRILLTEDNELSQKVVSRILNKYGYNVEIARNGKEALDLYNTNYYNLILMDVQIPEMDGLETTRRIRQIEKKTSRYTPIVALTAFKSEEDFKLCMEAGMDTYVSKPIQPKDFVHTIERFLSENKKRTKQEENVFNSGVLLQRLDNDIELIEELLSIFYTDLPVYIQKLKQFLSMKDYENAKQIVHTIQGAAVNIEAISIRNAALNIENQISESDFEYVNELVNDLEDEYEKFKIAATSYFHLI